MKPFDPLIQDLRRALGRDQVLAEPGDRFIYAYDAGLDKRLPRAVVLPRNAEDVAAAVRLARAAGVPYTARGAGTNLCGGSVPAPGGLVIHLSRMSRIVSVDEHRRRAWVEPGVVNLQLQKALAPRGLAYAPDPASQKACTLGGNVGTNAGGPHCLKYGVTSTHVTALQVVLPDGSQAHFSVDRPGYDVTGLLVGSEGTLGIVTGIELNLMPLPEDVQTFLAAFPGMEAAAHTVTDIIASGVVPSTLEVMDRLTVEAVEAFVGAGYPTDAEAVLLIEVDGDRERTRREAEGVRSACARNGATLFRQAADEREREKLWEGRRGAYPAMARLAPNVLVEDGVVPRHRLPEAVRRVRAIANREGLRMGLIAHAGDGNLHPNIVFDERDRDLTRRVKEAGMEMLRVCVDLGGSISGEHGIGVDKREAMRWLFTPPTLRLFRRVKEAFDPDNLCNPDKILPDAPPPAPPAGPGSEPSSRPGTREDLCAALLAAAESGRTVTLRGAGAAEGAVRLDLSGLDRVVDHDRDNFTVTVEAGLALPALRAYLAPHGQFAHVAGEGTLERALSTGAGRGLRDQVLGLVLALPDGTLAALGGKVMKNVAGYDAAKLVIGAWGTLGVVAQATLRLHARPMEAPGEPPAAPPKFADLPDAPIFRRIKSAFDPGYVMERDLFPRETTARAPHPPLPREGREPLFFLPPRGEGGPEGRKRGESLPRGSNADDDARS